jgi:ectoine hydroxylase
LRRTEATDTTDEIIREPGHGDIRSIFKVHESNLLFNKLASDNRLAGLAQYLLADEIYVHQSRVNYKPGFRGKEFYWHSDFETWHIEDGMPRMRALSVSITLTENHPYNGPLLLIHYRSSLKQQQYGVPSDALLQQMAQRGGIVSATGKAGSVIVFDCNTMHGSGSNITPFPRSNVFMVYNALSNRVVEPCHGLTPRPEYLCSRQQIKAITPQTVDYGNS